MTIEIKKRLDGIFTADRITVEPDHGKERLDPAELFKAFKSSALNLDHVLSTYETTAREALAVQGFKLKDILKAYLTARAKGLDAITVDLLTVLFMAEEVRADVAGGNAAGAAWNAVFLCRAAERAEIRPLNLEKHLQRSYKSESDGKKSGEKSGEVRQAKAKPKHEVWQAEAEKIWRRPKHSTLSKKSVAEIIEREKKIDGKADYIRHHIKKPLL